MRQRDIVIAGGGMVGVSLALELAAALPASVSITLVEGFPLPDPARGAAYHPSFDARSTALSFSSRKIYEQTGVWSALEAWLCDIARIHVSNRGRFGSAVLSSEEQGWPALGYVVENAWLGSALLRVLLARDRVEVLSPARVLEVIPAAEGVRLRVEGSPDKDWQAQLLIVADGADSGLRDALGIGVRRRAYDQAALIANVGFAQPHRHCAFERFTASGPLALLPLLGTAEVAHRSALVWTLPPAEAARLAEVEPVRFLEALQAAFGYRLGRFTRVGERATYPLARVEAEEQVRGGLVVMGNAAHTLHPVAGQGFNLALRDVAQLARTLAAAAPGQPLGDLALLQRYRSRQQRDQRQTIGASDLLPNLFMRREVPLGLARDLALSGLDLVPALKRDFVRQAAGVAALGRVARD